MPGILRLGHPQLRRKALPISRKDLTSVLTRRLIASMIRAMRASQGVGLAANQICSGKRIAVIESRRNPRYPHSPEIPLMVLINPVFTWMSREKIHGWEGCLSVPGLRGEVGRSRAVRVSAIDREGRPVEIETDTFLAVILQHELDHLDGHVYLDRMRDFSRLAYMTEYRKYWLPREK